MKKIKNQKSIAKEKNNYYNNGERIIFQKLPEIKEKSKKTYLISFVLIFILMYSGVLGFVGNKLGITLSTTSILVMNILLFTISSIILITILKDTFKRDFKYYKKNMKDYLKYGISTLIVFGVIELILSNIIGVIVTESPINDVEVKKLPFAFKLICGCILGPIVEECLFRGLLKKIIKNKYIFLFVSSVLFGALHVIDSVPANPLQMLYILTYSVAGFSLAYNYEKTDNLVSPIVMHIISNCIAFMF